MKIIFKKTADPLAKQHDFPTSIPNLILVSQNEQFGQSKQSAPPFAQSTK